MMWRFVRKNQHFPLFQLRTNLSGSKPKVLLALKQDKLKLLGFEISFICRPLLRNFLTSPWGMTYWSCLVMKSWTTAYFRGFLTPALSSSSFFLNITTLHSWQRLTTPGLLGMTTVSRHYTPTLSQSNEPISPEHGDESAELWVKKCKNR